MTKAVFNIKIRHTIQAAAWPGRPSFISGELKSAEIAYTIFMSDWRALMTSRKATLDSLRTLS
jgi:hypothetical protein